MTDKKRPRDETSNDAGASEYGGGSGATSAEHSPKRRRLRGVGYGLGAFAGLVGKAFRLTASVFAGGSGHQRSSQAGADSAVHHGVDKRQRGVAAAVASTQTKKAEIPAPGAESTAPCFPRDEARPTVESCEVAGGCGVGTQALLVEGSGARQQHQPQPPPQEQHAQQRNQTSQHQQHAEEDESLGLGLGLPNLDVDALRHSLGFLLSGDLARFALASTAAREIVSGHAALIIAERYAGRLRLGVREARPQSSPRRLAFGAGTQQAGTGGGGPAVAVAPGAAVGAVPAPQGQNNVGGTEDAILNNLNSSHGELWEHDAAAEQSSSRRGSASGSGPSMGDGAAAAAARGAVGGREQRLRRRDRHGWIVGGDTEFVRYGGKTLDLALPALHHLECCGELLLRQLKTLPRLDVFRTLQSRAVLGPSQYLTAHMRAVLVDWCVEVAFQFRLSTISLHAAVSALDVCLSKVAVPRCRLQLLGVVCAMIQSQAGGGCQVMSTAEAIHICDSQYNPSQVHSTFNIVVSNTQEATARTVPATAAEILHRHLLSMGQRSGLVRPLSVDWEKHSLVLEENVLAGLLLDLSLLDQYMFKFRPGTLAAAALFLARVTAAYYSKEEVWVTPFAVVEKTNREVLRLYGKGVCSPFVEQNEDLEKKPFGAPGLGEFVASQPREAAAVRKCVDRLWLVQQDFFKHVSGVQSPHPVLFRYQHMFKGIKDKFVPMGSIRLQAYVRLGLMVKCTVLFALASALSAPFADAAEFKVRVRNLTYQQPFSPPLIVAHTNDVALFKEGFAASDAIKLMAEDGDNSALLELAESEAVAPYVCGAVVADGPVFPGETWRGTMEVDEELCPDAQYSVVTMLIHTNDAFVGIDSEDLNFYGSSKAFPPAFDAGTEANNELCSHIPGPACGTDSGNLQDGPGEGFIHIHRGFHGVGPDLTEAGYDWRNPVAEVFIAAQ
eukprot:g14981.t1